MGPPAWRRRSGRNDGTSRDDRNGSVTGLASREERAVGADGDATAGSGQPDPAGPTAGRPQAPATGPEASGPASAVGPGSPDREPAVGAGPSVPDREAPAGAGPSVPNQEESASEVGPPAPDQALLSLVHAAKAFGAVRAVVDASIDLFGGEAHALVGENGAGKSTVVKMLAGVHQPDEGELLIEGQPAVLTGPAAAQAAGIAVIYQEPTLFPDLTVAEHIFMGRQPLVAARRIDRRAMRAQAAALFERLGVQLDPGRIARGLSIADQQIVEIAKALSLEARVIVMDEPTAALSAAEVARLFDVVRTLRAAEAAVLFISHRLEEVFEICQRVTVMRDGRTVLARGTQPARGRGAAGGAPGPGGSVHRHLAARAGGGDRRAGRAGRLGPQRGGAGHLRDRPLRRRKGDHRRHRTPPGIARGRDGGGDRLRAGGPAPAGPGHGHVDP